METIPYGLRSFNSTALELICRWELVHCADTNRTALRCEWVLVNDAAGTASRMLGVTGQFRA
jgi:hypothetical protein